MTDQKKHWGNVYQTKLPDQVSWFQPHLAKSLKLISESGIDKGANIIDVGGGASTLADDLLAKGFSQVTILDISVQALNQSKKRLGKKAKSITCLEADILKASLPASSFDLWHDRAVFHFLTKVEDRKAYLEVLKQSLKPNGFVVIATFSLEGPCKCSGLEVSRYSSETLSKELGKEFKLVSSLNECHKTPFGASQNFVYCLFQRNSITLM